MRPVQRGASTQATDFDPYGDARDPLRGRLGPYCSFCERRVDASLAVEHIQPKGLPAYAHLKGRWTNFLLACANCNATKGTKDFLLSEVLLPDRDNTFHAFVYTADGAVSVRPGLSPAQEDAAQKTLEMVGLDKDGYEYLDDNGKQVVVDRISKRKEVWSAALNTCEDAAASGLNERRLKTLSDFAQASGCFSVWMTVFEGMNDVRVRLIEDHPGTVGSGCFDLATGAYISPHPNTDVLASGSKI
ncbi:HNH endonuclease [Agrobacterium sp. NPDC090283]|uniref:HNH endonuclease n=1 Tax=Agrobacterium sp. NPDC090283 TaxID=3363920 RepID=UPI00383AACE7